LPFGFVAQLISNPFGFLVAETNGFAIGHVGSSFPIGET